MMLALKRKYPFSVRGRFGPGATPGAPDRPEYCPQEGAGTEAPMAPEIPLDKQRPNRLLFGDSFGGGIGKMTMRPCGPPNT